MNRFAIAVSILFASLSIVAANDMRTPSSTAVTALVDELLVGVIDKVDGNTITFTKSTEKNNNKFLQGGKVKGPKGETVVYTALDKVKVARAGFDPTAKKPKNAGVIVGEDIPDGLKNEIFAKGDARVRVTVNSDKRVTEVLIFEKKK